MRTHLTTTLALALLVAAPASAKTIKVGPGQSVQAAVDSASSGDKIVISGIHREHVSVNTPGVTLIGKNGTIDGQYIAYAVAVWVPDVTVKGLKIIHGAPGIRVIADRVKILENSFAACAESSLYVDGDDVQIRKNDIESGAGVLYTSATAGSHSRFEKNDATHCATISLSGGRLTVEENTFTGCDGVAITATAATSLVRKNTATRLGSFLVTASGSATVEIVKNDFLHAEDDGLFVELLDAASADVRENTAERPGDDGFSFEIASTGNLTTFGNRAERVSDDGFTISIDAVGALTMRHDEVERCEDDGIDLQFSAGSTGTARIEDAKIRGAGDNGLELDNVNGTTITAEGCDIRRCIDDGINAGGSASVGIELVDNVIKQCDEDGIDATGDAFTIRGNAVKSCGQQGIQLYPETFGGSTVEKNVVRECGRDGIWISADSTEVVENLSIENRGDGIEIDGGSANVVSDNVCKDNAHEGIDNRGSTTIIRDNQMSGNGGALGPDLAGAGDGTGTVGIDSTGNEFGTGGLAELQRLDQ